MTDFLDYLFINDREVKWRMGWYNEIKVPMLTAAILADTGRSSLNERVDLLHSFVVSNVLPSLPGNTLALTKEEEFVQFALRNRRLHARAKLIVMQFIGLIQDPTKKVVGSKVSINPKEVTVTQLFGEMVKVMTEEFPELAEEINLQKMVTDNNNAKNEDDIDVELQADNSTEAKIEREVKKQLQAFSKNN